MGYLMPKTSFLKNSSITIVTFRSGETNDNM